MESAYEYAKIKFKLFFSARLKDEPCEEIFEEFVQNYGSEETKIAIDIACNYYSDFLTAFKKIGGILYRRKVDCKKYFETQEPAEDSEHQICCETQKG